MIQGVIYKGTTNEMLRFPGAEHFQIGGLG